MRILVTLYCGKELRERFKLWVNINDVLCCSDYAERLISNFSRQIQSEYYGGNRSVSIEGIALEQFSVSQYPIP